VGVASFSFLLSPFDVIILLGVHDTGVEPEEPPVFNALKELSEVAGSAAACAVGPQVRPKYFEHCLPAVAIASSTGLCITVHTARLLVPLQ
jgi:hypothetical protein